MRRFEFLDYIRGIAALAVVIFHRGILSSFSGPMFLIAKYGEVGVQIFFVISGYVIYQSVEKYFGTGIKGISSFLYKRFRRIYPALWASLGFTFVVAIAIQKEVFYFGDYLTSISLTYSIFGYKAPQVVYWSLVFEQQFYIVMAILILPVFNKYRNGLILASSLIAILVPLQIVSNWYVNTLLPAHWLEFELGILAFLIINQRISRKVTLPIFALLVAVGLMGNYRTQTAVAFACAVFGLAKIDPVIASKRYLLPFQFLGKISYSLYLIHLPTLIVFDQIFKSFFAKGSLVFYFLGIFMVLGVATVFYYFFEKPFLVKKEKVAIAEPAYV